MPLKNIDQKHKKRVLTFVLIKGVDGCQLPVLGVVEPVSDSVLITGSPEPAGVGDDVSSFTSISVLD